MHGSELWNERVGGCEKSASAACAASLLLYLYADLMATNSSRLGVALRRRRTHRLVAMVQHKALRQMKQARQPREVRKTASLHYTALPTFGCRDYMPELEYLREVSNH